MNAGLEGRLWRGGQPEDRGENRGVEGTLWRGETGRTEGRLWVGTESALSRLISGWY